MASDEDFVFGKLKPVIQPPNLIEIQTQSFADFLQADVSAGKRQTKGLQAIFKEVFPSNESIDLLYREASLLAFTYNSELKKEGQAPTNQA